MLTLKIQDGEVFDERTFTFNVVKGTTLRLEHSLISISKWEALYHKPFLSTGMNQSDSEIMDYIRCMCIDSNNPSDTVIKSLTDKQRQQITDYIANPMTATTFWKDPMGGGVTHKRGRETITSELIYYWMFSLQIPIECEKWHINRLLTLIQLMNVKNQPPKKYSRKQIMSENQRLNALRRQQYNTKG